MYEEGKQDLGMIGYKGRDWIGERVMVDLLGNTYGGKYELGREGI